MKIQTKLSLEESVSLLKSTTVEENFFRTKLLPSGTIICQLRGQRFRLRQQRWYGNAFAPFFHGELSPKAGGTEISGEFRMLPFVIPFMAVWFGGAILGGLAIALKSIRQWMSGHDQIGIGGLARGLFEPLIMPGLGAAFVLFGKRLGRSEEVRMTTYLQQTFSQGLTTINVPPPATA
jgi:hypothetical protein